MVDLLEVFRSPGLWLVVCAVYILLNVLRSTEENHQAHVKTAALLDEITTMHARIKRIEEMLAEHEDEKAKRLGNPLLYLGDDGEVRAVERDRDWDWDLTKKLR